MPRRGIELVAVGVGMGNYNDALMEQLADQGDGFYAYVDGLDEARRLFREDLTGTLQTVALDARAQVEFDPDGGRRLPAARLREPRHRRPRLPRRHASTPARSAPATR